MQNNQMFCICWMVIKSLRHARYHMMVGVRVALRNAYAQIQVHSLPCLHSMAE